MASGRPVILMMPIIVDIGYRNLTPAVLVCYRLLDTELAEPVHVDSDSVPGSPSAFTL